jgi:hypothetical protein
MSMAATQDQIVALARTALLEITPETSVGQVVETLDEGEGVVSVQFANRMAGYPGWRWTVSVAQVDGDEPTVLEAELMPGDGSLLAPDWVPWSERLAEYRAAQHEDESEDDSDDSDDDDDDDDSDDDAESDDVLDGDDDGIDVDEDDLDDDDDDDDDDSDDDDDADDLDEEGSDLDDDDEFEDDEDDSDDDESDDED